MKKFLLILVILSLLGYLVFTTLYFEDNTNSKVCEKFEVVVKDSIDKKFIQTKDIELLLKKEGLHPLGKPLSEVNTMEMEEVISSNKLVKSVEVYITQNAGIVASIRQRNPMFRVISNQGESYYIDSERERMPTSQNYTVYLPLVTGYLTEEYAVDELYDFVRFVSTSETWDAWIEQIVVNQNQKVQIVPRAGDFIVTLGSLEDYEKKLKKFKIFIDKGLSTVGWNRYSKINLEYNNQVVCTLK